MKQNSEDSLVLDESSWETETQEKQTRGFLDKLQDDKTDVSSQEVIDYMSDVEKVQQVIGMNGALYPIPVIDGDKAYDMMTSKGFTDRFKKIKYRGIIESIDKKPVYLSTAYPLLVEPLTGINYNPNTTDMVLPSGELNMYNGWRVKAEEGNITPLLNLIDTALENHPAEEKEWFLCWFADIFVNPGTKGRTCIIAKSDYKGSFKSLLGDEIMAGILGSNYYQTSDIQHLIGEKNSHTSFRLLIQGDEVSFAIQGTANQKLKNDITSKKRNIRKLYQEQYTVNDYARYYLTGNSKTVMPIESGERRYATYEFNSLLAEKVRVLKGNEKYAKIATEFQEWFNKDKDKALGNILYYFLQMGDRIKAADISLTPNTEANQEAKVEGMGSFCKFLYERATEQRETEEEELEFGGGETILEKTLISKAAVLEEYIESRFVDKDKIKYITSATVKKEVELILGKEATHKTAAQEWRVDGGASGKRAYKLPHGKDMLDAIEKYLTPTSS